MRYLPFVALLCKTVTCLTNASSLVVVTDPSVATSSEPSSFCQRIGLQPYMLRAEDVPNVMSALKARNISRAAVAGWNDEKIEMVIGASAGDVTPLAPINRTTHVLCMQGGSAPTPVAPGPVVPSTPSAPIAPVAPGPVVPSTPSIPCSPCATAPCAPPMIEIKDSTVCPSVCCLPKKCVVKRRASPCDSPCVANYSHSKVYIVDELTVSCGNFLRIVETKCKPFRKETIFTIAKTLPHSASLPFPNVLRNASLLHRILCNARDKFGQCGCVCLFIDHFNNIFIAVDNEFYRVVIRRPCLPMPPFPMPRLPGRFPFPPFPFPRPCMPACPPQPFNCSPCAKPIKCKPSNPTDACGKPCPPDFIFCKVSCEAMIPIRRRGLYAVLFSRSLDY
ncbi:hypothetical protein NEHOM01_2352 [Nematocida homosporus]|uniref:uncharacterized protein n=1 Tax=Nematocida homosporus TaxID=1912981 RepID=UPI00221E7133|nr:uncharacterized protein NEHOM01_2352 [Nematocida homosporus]KAI5187765.1 hypothetical protein NEHOM01_2352 [Nematocida homosporus]